MAFQLTSSAEGLEWFIEPLQNDEQFVFARDQAEAARMASILLRYDIHGGDRRMALAVVVASVEGFRSAADERLLPEAQAAIIDTSVTFDDDASSPVTALVAEDQYHAVRQSFNADQVVALVQVLDAGARSALADERAKSRRLAEELNMLWWYIGGWSTLLKCPRSELSAKKTPIVLAADLASFVQSGIGPYGARALLDRLLESDSVKSITLVDALDALDQGELEKLIKLTPADAPELFPVSLAMQLAQQTGAGNWHVAFEKNTKLKATKKFSKHHLAVQLYNERVLLNGA